MRLIDADAFRRELDNHWPFTKEEQSKHGIADMAKSTLLVVLNNMPTIDAVEVVRCKDCRWNNGENYCLNDGTFFELCADDAYCSFGERRTNG